VKAALGGTGISSNSQAIRQRGNLGVNSNFTYNAAICTAWPCYESSRVSQNDVSAVCAVDHSLDGQCSHSGVRGRKFPIRIRSRFPSTAIDTSTDSIRRAHLPSFPALVSRASDLTRFAKFSLYLLSMLFSRDRRMDDAVRFVRHTHVLLDILTPYPLQT